MRLTDINEFDAVIARAEPIIHTIVARHRTSGLPLTWRLIHSIESEVLAELNRSNDLQPAYINLIKHSGVFKYPLNDDPVDSSVNSLRQFCARRAITVSWLA